MARWKKDETQFQVSVIHLEHRNLVNIPKPIIEYLKNPPKITFKIEKNGKISIS